jgi:hypothetical protein
MDVTRRTLARILAATAVVPVEVDAQAPASSGDELRAAREELKSRAARMAAVRLPMSAEPAFRFKP